MIKHFMVCSFHTALGVVLVCVCVMVSVQGDFLSQNGLASAKWTGL